MAGTWWTQSGEFTRSLTSNSVIMEQLTTFNSHQGEKIIRTQI